MDSKTNVKEEVRESITSEEGSSTAEAETKFENNAITSQHYFEGDYKIDIKEHDILIAGLPNEKEHCYVDNEGSFGNNTSKKIYFEIGNKVIKTEVDILSTNLPNEEEPCLSYLERNNGNNVTRTDGLKMKSKIIEEIDVSETALSTNSMVVSADFVNSREGSVMCNTNFKLDSNTESKDCISFMDVDFENEVKCFLVKKINKEHVMCNENNELGTEGMSTETECQSGVPLSNIFQQNENKVEEVEHLQLAESSRLNIHAVYHKTPAEVTESSQISKTAYSLRSKKLQNDGNSTSLLNSKGQAQDSEKQSQQKNIGKNFTCRSTLKTDKVTAFHKCTICDKNFSVVKRLEAHYLTVHKKKDSCKCLVCKKPLSSKIYLKKHTVTVHESRKPHECNVCKNRFTRLSDLKAHSLFIHEGKTLHKCNVCKKGFNRLSHLKAHTLAVHDVKKPHECNICKMRFIHMSFLKSHTLMVHEGKRPHECNVCKKGFTLPAHLKAHTSAVHEGKRPHECNVCKKGFSRLFSLKTHTAMVHEGKRPHECNVCKKQYTTPSHLKAHTLAVHEGKRPYICNICNKGFSYTSTLKDHTLIHLEKMQQELAVHVKTENIQFNS